MYKENKKLSDLASLTLKKSLYLNKHSTFHLYAMVSEWYTLNIYKEDICKFINNVLSCKSLDYVCYLNKRCISHVVYLENKTKQNTDLFKSGGPWFPSSFLVCSIYVYLV